MSLSQWKMTSRFIKCYNLFLGWRNVIFFILYLYLSVMIFVVMGATQNPAALTRKLRLWPLGGSITCCKHNTVSLYVLSYLKKIWRKCLPIYSSSRRGEIIIFIWSLFSGHLVNLSPISTLLYPQFWSPPNPGEIICVFKLLNARICTKGSR